MALVASTYADLFTFSRAGLATDTDIAGNYTEFGTNNPRYGYSSGTPGWLIEPQMTNYIRNPRCEGAVVGGDATTSMPTNWGSVAGTADYSMTVTGTGTTNGVQWVELTGYAIRGGTARINFEGGAGPSGLSIAAAGVATLSCFTQFVGVIPPEIISTYLRATSADTPTINVATDNTFSRKSATFTFTAGTASSAISLNVFFSAACQFTIRVGWPQFEIQPYATSPILPPIGTTSVQAVRDPDYQRTKTSAFTSIFGATASQGAVIMDIVPINVPYPTNNYFIQIDDGTTSNRMYMRTPTASLGLAVISVVGGSTLSGLNQSGLVAGVPARIGVAWGNGRAVTAMNGVAGTELVTAIPVTDTIRFGRGTSGTGAISNMRTKRIAVYNYNMTNAQFAALTA